MKKDGFMHYVTLNAQIIRLANEDPNYMAILNKSKNSIDGRVPLYFFKKLRRNVQIEQVSGSRELNRVVDYVIANNCRIFFIGASNSANENICNYINENTGSNLASYYPNAVIKLPISTNDNISILESIIEFKPNIIVASLGAPKQEYWINSLRDSFEEIGVDAAYGLGGSVEMFANPRMLAPNWVSRFGLESFWRLIAEPLSLKRYQRILYSFGFLRYL